MNIKVLRMKMFERGITVERLAEMIGVDRATLYRRFNDGEKFTIGEARKIKDVLHLTNEEATIIFLL